MFRTFQIDLEILFFVTFCRGQFLTPELLREQHELSYSARTHYETSGSQRTDAFNRVNPDYLLYGRFSYPLFFLF